MKIAVNGKLSNEALKSILNEQVEKVKTIDLFCKDNKLIEFSYKDNILEYTYQPKQVVKKVEVRNHETKD